MDKQDLIDLYIKVAGQPGIEDSFLRYINTSPHPTIEGLVGRWDELYHPISRLISEMKTPSREE